MTFLHNAAFFPYYKNKVLPVLKHHAMKIYGGVEVKYHTLYTLASGGGIWLASCSVLPP
jgi:hypothetical protein